MTEDFEAEAYEEYRELIFSLNGQEPACPKEGAPIHFKYKLLLKKYTNKVEDTDYEIQSLNNVMDKLEKLLKLTPFDGALKLIKKHKKRMNELKYGTWSPGPDGKREMTGILDLSKD